MWRRDANATTFSRLSSGLVRLGDLAGYSLRSTGWWGMLCLIATEGILFAYLSFSCAYLGSQSPGPWPATGPSSRRFAGPDTLILLASSFTLLWGALAFERRRSRAAVALAIAVTWILGVIFVAIQGLEWSNRPFSFDSSSYNAIYFT